MDWSDEVRLGKFGDAEAGLLCKVRLTFRNRFDGLATDADDVFGPGWPGRVERLRRAGVLRVERAGDRVVLTVVAVGDRKREIVRNATRKYRAAKTKGTK